MKLHHTLVERLLRIYSTYGGYREDTRLRAELAALDVSEYTKGDGEVILVDSDEMQKQMNQIKTKK